MILTDVNVLIYAYRTEAVDHERYRSWLQSSLDAEFPFGISDLILSAVVRILTHPRVWRRPVPLENVMQYVEWLRSHPRSFQVAPGERHWRIFADLCTSSGAKGNLITDAYFAALAIESGAEWITTDRDYSRFPGLRWRHPLS